MPVPLGPDRKLPCLPRPLPWAGDYQSNVRWGGADGSDHSAEITFHPDHSSDFFWRDSGGSITGQVFTGGRQSAGEGPLDFRGMEMPR